jgi:CelD/BcsL family acetyltransferase involved in cellulose biosynthesis
MSCGGASGPLSVEWRALDDAEELVPAWRALAARALEPNVFYEPAFARPAAIPFGRRVRLGLVRSGSAELLGLFPVRVARRYGLGPALLTGWTHAYAPLGTPLVDRDVALPVIEAWLDHLAGAKVPRFVLLPLLPEGAFAQTLHAALARRGCPHACFDHHHRALLAPGAHRTDYLARRLGGKTRKEIARRLRRMSEQAPVAFTAATAPADVGPALEEFFAVEASGWKGRRGTAAARLPLVSAFMRQAVQNLSASGQVRIDRLTVDGRAAAVIIVLRSGDTVWGWKIAYDERYGRFSPGVQLMCRLTEALLADPSVARIDSCAAPNHPMIDHLWGERLALGDLMFAVDPRAAVPFARAARLEAVRRRFRNAAKALYKRVF